MDIIQATINNINTMFTLNNSEQQSIRQFLSTSLNTRFQFGHDFFLLKDVVPTTLINAITPYADAGLQIDAAIMVLEARYHENKFSFEFEIDYSFEGLKSLLLENTSIKNIVVNPVYENDLLHINHSSQEVNHNVSAEPSKLHGLYCIIDLDNGQSFLAQMSASEASEAMYANINERLNGVNPYTTNSKKLMFYKTSCLRRALKTISALKNAGDLEFVSKLLSLHDRQFNKAKALRKVMPLNNYKFRGCSRQPSTIDHLFKNSKGNVVIPFAPLTQKSVTKSEPLPPANNEDYIAWGSDIMGVGF